MTTTKDIPKGKNITITIPDFAVEPKVEPTVGEKKKAMAGRMIELRALLKPLEDEYETIKKELDPLMDKGEVIAIEDVGSLKKERGGDSETLTEAGKNFKEKSKQFLLDMGWMELKEYTRLIATPVKHK